jgi:uncharacterized Zn-binding protein involved in type VI secretion
MPSAIRKDDDQAGGTLIEGSPDVIVNNKSSVRLGDAVAGHGDCPHCSATMSEGSSTVLVNNKPMSFQGNQASCGHTASSSSNVIVGDSSFAAAGVTPPGVDIVGGTPVYQDNTAGRGALKQQEDSVDPGIASNHEGADPPGQVESTPLSCNELPTEFTKDDLLKQISKYFTLADAKMTFVAQRGFTAQQIACNWVNLCVKILDPVYDNFKFKKGPLNSGFRTLTYNRQIGSKDTSDHTKGAAADISLGSQEMNKVMFKWILSSNLPFSQLIFEGNWVHVAFNGNGPKGNARVMYTYTGRRPISAGNNGENLPADLKP